MYAADKAQHVHEVVLPGLRRGAVVISDRYVDSMLAYQGAGRVLEPERVEQVARWATGDLLPDLTVLLDLDPDRGLATIDVYKRQSTSRSVRRSPTISTLWIPRGCPTRSSWAPVGGFIRT